MDDKQKVIPDTDYNGGIFKAESLEDLIQQLKQLQQENWTICDIEAMVVVKRHPID